MSWSGEEYTKCSECGKWDSDHTADCILGWREAYINGDIEVEEFEAKLEEALAT